MKDEFLHPMSCTVQAVFGLSQYCACPLTVVLYQLILATNDACLLQHIYNVYARSLEKCWGKYGGLTRWTRLLGMARQVWQTVQAIIHHQFCTYGRQVHTVSTQRPTLQAQTLYHRHYIIYAADKHASLADLASTVRGHARYCERPNTACTVQLIGCKNSSFIQ